MDYVNSGEDISSQIVSSITDSIPSALANETAGYEQPQDIKLNPLLKISPIKSFDYEGALKDGLTPTEILDIMEQEPNYRKEFNFTEARANIADDLLVANMRDESEIEKVNLARSKAYHAGIDNDFALGINKAATGIRVLAEDLKFWKDFEEKEKTISTLQNFAKDMERARHDKDFFSAFTAGDMAAQIAVMPLAAQSRLGTFAIEGVLGYASGRAEGSKGEAVVEGAISGTLGAGVAHLMRGMNGEVAKSTYNKFINRELITPELKEAFELYKKDWDEVIDFQVDRPSLLPGKGFSLNPNNPNFYKINDEAAKDTAALIDFLSGPGSRMKEEVSELSMKAEVTIKTIRQNRIDSVNSILSKVNLSDIYGVGEALQKGISTIMEDFGRVKDSIGIMPVNKSEFAKFSNNFSEEALTRLDEAARPDARILRDALEDETINSLMDANIALNSIMRKASDKDKKFKLQELKDTINKKLQDSLPPTKYSEYRAMNRDYGIMVGVRDSKVNEVIQAASNEKATPEEALRLINQITGKELFTHISWLIGTEQATKLELLTMKDAFRNSKSTSWSALGKQIDGKGFSTPEGKALRETIQKFSELFNIDNLVTDAMHKGELIQGGAKSDAVSQIKGAFWRSLFLNIQKHIPFTEIGERSMHLHTVMQTLKNPQKLKTFIEKAENFNKPVAHREVQRLIKELPRYPSPGQAIPNVGGKVNPVFNSQISTNAIQEGVEEALKDVMFSKLAQSQKNAVIDSAFKHFDGTRFPDKIASMAKLLKEDRVKHNAKLFEASIKGEAELMAKAIEKDHGVKVDSSMMKGLIEYVTERTMKECK